jgi:Iodothyronine deiodinase
VDEYTSLVSDFKDKADFVAVYIEEAHPTDGWHFSDGPKFVDSFPLALSSWWLFSPGS